MRGFKCIDCGEMGTPWSYGAKLCDKCKEKRKKAESNKKAARYSIFERDGFKCIYCGASPIEDGAKLCIEHIVPKSKGGNNTAYNTVTACWECNKVKGVKELTEDTYNRILIELVKRNDIISDENLVIIRQIFDIIYPEGKMRPEQFAFDEN